MKEAADRLEQLITSAATGPTQEPWQAIATKAARRLISDVRGMLGMEWNALVELLGVTNVRCLQRNSEELAAFLPTPPASANKQETR